MANKQAVKDKPSRNKLGRVLRKYKYTHMLGGKCSKCGYKKNLAALVFHHAGEKRMRLSGSGLYETNHATIMAELTQCELLCHNCHHSLHNPDMCMTRISKLYAMCKLNKTK